MRTRAFLRPVPAALLTLLLALPSAAIAATITGVVKTEGGVPVGNVDIDFIDLCSGDNVFLASDHTAADGTFSISVADGTYDVHFIPPAGAVEYAGDFQDFVAAGVVGMGTVTLHPGRLVSGTVLTPSLAPAASVDLKWVDVAADHRVFLSKTVTDAAGHYAIRVPPGTWDVDFRPVASSPFADGERLSLVVGASDLAGLSDALRTGFTVTGHVRGESNVNLKNVDLDVFDDCTGRRIPNAHDNTDVNGNFSIVVPAGRYTFAYDPPACAGVYAERDPGIVIAGATSMGTITLKAAVAVSGRVHGPDGLPLAGAKVKFYDVTQVGAPRQGAARDRTDATGAFSILVPAGTYDINIEPPPGVNALVHHINNQDTGGGVDLGTITLTAGIPLSGHVAGPGNAPQLNVNINVLDQLTRVSQRISHDNTDANGDFTVYVNPGTYDIHYDTPACSGMAPAQQVGVTVASATALPTMNVVPGVHLAGSVTDAASLPVANVNLDVYPAGGTTKLYTPGATTSATGAYDVFVAPASLDVRYLPPALVPLRPVLRSGVGAFSTMTLSPTVLPSGWIVSGTVRDQGSLLPIAGVTIDFFPSMTLPALWTPHHVTGTAGTFGVVVDAGTYDVRFTPPAGSPYAERWLHGVGVASDVALPDTYLSAASTGVAPEPVGGLSFAAPAPNPARGAVQLAFAAPAGAAELSAWDVNGRRVATIWRGRSPAPVAVRWDGRGDGGRALPPGLYLIRLADARGASLLRRLTLLR